MSKLFMNNGKVLKGYMQNNQKNMKQKSEQRRGYTEMKVFKKVSFE